MLKGMGDIGSLLKLQHEAKNIQKKLKKTLLTAKSTDGLVEATVNGEFTLIEIKISDELTSNKSKLEKNIIEAVNNAVHKNKEFAAEEMSKLTGGMNIPGLSDFLK